MSECKGCIYNDEAYKEALQKAKANNSLLFLRQESLNKKKRMVDKWYVILHYVYIAIFIIALIGLIALFSTNHATLNMLLIGTSAACVVMMLLNIITLVWYRRFWDEASKQDYELYQQEKIEFAKVGYELP